MIRAPVSVDHALVRLAIGGHRSLVRHPSRRAVIAGALAAIAPRSGSAQQPATGHGRVTPAVEVPNVSLTTSDGNRVRLHDLIKGQAIAVQLMFTGCSSICPIEAAIFKAVQGCVPDQVQRRVLLLSLSVAPFGEAPGALDAWMRHSQAGPGWLAAAPDAADLPRVQDFFGQGSGFDDSHSAQVQVIDRKGRLVWRTSELPAAEDVAAILQQL